MPRSRQSNRAEVSSTWRAPGPVSGRGGRAFTLIELIFVLALLSISALLVIANVGGFVRGRTLNFEARRLLSLAQYGQSRAVSEGVPVVLWFNVKDNTYGLSVLSSFVDAEGDPKATTYAVEPTLTLEAPVDVSTPVSEDDDERLGLPEELAAIRFNPDGLVDNSSIPRVVIRQGNASAIALVPTSNRLAYELEPVAHLE